MEVCGCLKGSSKVLLTGWAAFATKSKPDRKVISTAPVNAEESPEVWVDGENFKGTGDFNF